MKLTMFAAIGSIAGISACLLINYGDKVVKQHIEQERHLRQIMYAQATPLEQGPGTVAPAPSVGLLPLDAAAEPGILSEGSSRAPQIQLKAGQRISSPAREASAYLVLAKSEETIKNTKDPIWRLTLMSAEHTPLETLPSVTGRAYRQTNDRNQSGTKAPLPKGVYRVERMGIEAGPFADTELGRGFWIPITPLFATKRADLGIHQDPSWGKPNGESGTSGCVGLQSAEATIKVVSWIKHYNIQKLIVEN